MNFIKKNKLTLFVIGCILLCLILLGITFYSLFFSNANNNKYGDRLKGLSEIIIKDDTIDNIKTTIKKNSSVNDITYHLEGRLANFIIEVEPNLSSTKAKKLANTITSKLSDKQLSYYDIQVFIKIKEDEKSKTYPIIGSRHKTSKSFSWTNN